MKNKLKNNEYELKDRILSYIMDLVIIGAILGLIVYSWNTLLFRTFKFIEIGTKEAIVIGAIFIIGKNIFEAFFTKEKNIEKLFAKSGSMYRSASRNSMIIASLVIGYIALFFINLLFFV